MLRAVVLFAAGILIASPGVTGHCQTLAKAGTISFHTGGKNTASVMDVADKRVQGQGVVTGVTFNDKGSGPLHLGGANCSFAFIATEGDGKNLGYCTFGDTDGDRIFVDFTGGSTPDGVLSGSNRIIGGTGKYAGIQGGGPWKCRFAGANGEYQCMQQLDYRLP